MSQSDPNPAPGRRSPPRAEPLQPDAPARGQDREPQVGPDDHSGLPQDPADREASVRRQKEQADQALANVRKGY